MKIVLSGSQSVGKTTVMNEIEKSPMFQGHTFIREIVRTLMKKGIQINKGADHKSQVAILEEHYRNTFRYSSFVSDRGAIDAFAYATWDYLQGNYTLEQHKEHEQLFLSCLKAYEVYFYIPPEFEIVPDGVRAVDKDYQHQIHEIFIELYRRYHISYVTVTGTVQERVDYIQNVFLDHGLPY